MLSVKLRHLTAWTDARRNIAAQYVERLEAGQVQTVAVDPRACSSFHMFVIQVEGRDAVRAALDRRGVQTGNPLRYPVPPAAGIRTLSIRATTNSGEGRRSDPLTSHPPLPGQRADFTRV